jgi:hypothetical protein
MNKIEQEKAVVEFFEKMSKLNEIKNPLLAMREFIKVSDWIGELFDKGYNQGFEEGKKSWPKNVPLN